MLEGLDRFREKTTIVKTLKRLLGWPDLDEITAKELEARSMIDTVESLLMQIRETRKTNEAISVVPKVRQAP